MNYFVCWELEGQEASGEIITDDPGAAISAAANDLDPDQDDLAAEVHDLNRGLRLRGAWHGRINVDGGVLTVGAKPVPLPPPKTFDHVLDDIMGPILEPIGTVGRKAPLPGTPDDRASVAQSMRTVSVNLRDQQRSANECWAEIDKVMVLDDLGLGEQDLSAVHHCTVCGEPRLDETVSAQVSVVGTHACRPASDDETTTGRPRQPHTEH